MAARHMRIGALGGWASPVAIWLLCGTAALAQGSGKFLRIGTSGHLALDESGTKQEAALDTLKSFIQSETGFNNEILRQHDWRELAEKMKAGRLDLGVFEGYEFAWARADFPELQPLAVTVNVHVYRVAYLVTRKGGKAADFAGLAGQSVAFPATGQSYLRLFVERLCRQQGKDLDQFFSQTVRPENVEDALDDVVDGKVGAAAVDRVGLEAFKRRKPGRFARLKDVAHSQPLPPPLVAFYGRHLDDATLSRFRDGLLNANRKEKGQTLLTFFKLTGFQTPPKDFDNVLAETRKAYPPEVTAQKAEDGKGRKSDGR
jgi:ABC-type phosphate/phosphonate transport system substrate-binding protein